MTFRQITTNHKENKSSTYFWSKVNIWNVNCARVTAFIFDTRTGVLVKVSETVFETENVSTWGGLEPPTFGFMP